MYRLSLTRHWAVSVIPSLTGMIFFGYYCMDHIQIFVDSLKTFGHVGQNSQESYKLWLMDVLRQYDEFKNR